MVEQYPPEMFSLLPIKLRKPLLLLLPAVDVCIMERMKGFVDNVDMEEVWREHFDTKISTELHCCWTPLRGRTNSSARYSYLETIFYVLVTNGAERGVRVHLTANYLLHGVRVEPSKFGAWKSFVKSGSCRLLWMTPTRYTPFMDPQVELVTLVRHFMENCQWFPKRIYLNIDFTLNLEVGRRHFNGIFQPLVSQVEELAIENGAHVDEHSILYSISLLCKIFANCKPQRLRSLSIMGGISLLPNLIHAVTKNLHVRDDTSPEIVELLATKGYYCNYSGLKEVRIIGDITPPRNVRFIELSETMDDLVEILEQQTDLEVVVLDQLADFAETNTHICPCRKKFGPVCNYLPRVIARPSLKCFKAESCLFPINALQNMVVAFLNRPATCNQLLDLGLSYVGGECFDTLPGYQLVEPVQPAGCISGSCKQLCLPGVSKFGLIDWIFRYPDLLLQKLQFTCDSDRESDFQPFCDALAAFSHNSRQMVHVCFVVGRKSEILPSMENILCVPSVIGADFVNCYEMEEGGILSVLTNALSSPNLSSSLKTINIQQFFSHDVPIGSFRKFFDALFRLPPQRLAEFSFELTRTHFGEKHFDALVNAWKANSQGQKLKMVSISGYRSALSKPAEKVVDGIAEEVVLLESSLEEDSEDEEEFAIALV